MKIRIKQTVMKEVIDTYEITLTPEDVKQLRETYDDFDDITADVWNELGYELEEPVKTEYGDGWEEVDFECDFTRGSVKQLKEAWEAAE